MVQANITLFQDGTSDNCKSMYADNFTCLCGELCLISGCNLVKIDSMKIFIKIQTALIALLVMSFVNCYAQTSDKVESIMNEIVKKHDGKDGAP